PNFRTSVYGSYLRVDYGSNANLAICNAQSAAAIGGSPLVAPPSAGAGLIPFHPAPIPPRPCSHNFHFLTVRFRPQYNFPPWFYVGFDVIYQKLEPASRNAVVTYTALGGTAKPTARYAIQDQDNYGLRIRVHRDIVP